MSFFQAPGDDSQLQYDDIAFLYFLATVLLVGILVMTVSVFRDLCKLRLKGIDRLEKMNIFNDKVRNIKKMRLKSVFSLNFAWKLSLLILAISLFWWVFNVSSANSNKLKGFDPYQILRINRNATAREITKAYRKLAVIYHPDKNHGNPIAQNMFILISKSYECFSDEKKKANCLKYGNPDGQTASRVGIGLPNFFIKEEYQIYVLPFVLFILLVLVPVLIIRWNNRVKMLDRDGISMTSYPMIFRVSFSGITKYTIPYILSSYPELNQDDISIGVDQKQMLQKFMKKMPQAQQPILHQMTDKQLYVFWQIIAYASNLKQFPSKQFRQLVQFYLSKTINVVKIFAQKELDKKMLFDNPQLIIKYHGVGVIDAYLQFQKDYYNRTLAIAGVKENWMFGLGLDESERNRLKQLIKDTGLGKNPYQMLSSATKIKQFCAVLPEGRREVIENQLKSWPVYNLELKLKVADKEVNSINGQDYAQLFYRIKLLNNCPGFSYVQNYPYPKKDKVYILGVQNNSFLFVKEVVVDREKGQAVGKVDHRGTEYGDRAISVFVVHESLREVDVFNLLKYTVKPFNLKDKKPIVFHREDLNLQSMFPNFFEEMINITRDPQEGQLSDSQDDKKKQTKEQSSRDNLIEQSESDSDQAEG